MCQGSACCNSKHSKNAPLLNIAAYCTILIAESCGFTGCTAQPEGRTVPMILIVGSTGKKIHKEICNLAGSDSNMQTTT